MRFNAVTESCITPSISTNDGGSGAAAGIIMTHRTGIAVDTGNDSGGRNGMTTRTGSVASEMGVRMTGMKDIAISMTIKAANCSTSLDYVLDS